MSGGDRSDDRLEVIEDTPPASRPDWGGRRLAALILVGLVLGVAVPLWVAAVEQRQQTDIAARSACRFDPACEPTVEESAVCILVAFEPEVPEEAIVSFLEGLTLSGRAIHGHDFGSVVRIRTLDLRIASSLTQEGPLPAVVASATVQLRGQACPEDFVYGR